MKSWTITNWRIPWNRWIERRHPHKIEHEIVHNRLYILPSRFGWLFILSVAALFIGAINYQVSTVFLLIFFLIICAMISAWQAHKNLLGIRIRCMPIPDGACQETIRVTLMYQSSSTLRYDIHLELADLHSQFHCPCLNTEQTIILSVRHDKRGMYQLPRLRLSTQYPLGLFTAWTWMHFKHTYAVYPRPHNPGYWPAGLDHESRTGQPAQEEDELYELRQIDNPWANRNRMAWKLAAKNQRWYIKILHNIQNEQCVFRLRDLQATNLEHQLQILCYWLISAEQKGVEYALQLRDEAVFPSHGEQHLRHCLRKLAAHQ